MEANLDERRKRRRESHKRWREKNLQKIRTYASEWAKRNPERKKANDKARYERKKKEIIAKGAAWRAANKDKTNLWNREWYRKNRVLALLKAHFIYGEDARKLKDEYDRGCRYCLSQQRLELDHVEPVSRGGSEDVSNRQWLCRNCNRAKNDLTEEEFFEHIERLYRILDLKRPR